jgi:hypothetical protein
LGAAGASGAAAGTGEYLFSLGVLQECFQLGGGGARRGMLKFCSCGMARPTCLGLSAWHLMSSFHLHV